MTGSPFSRVAFTGGGPHKGSVNTFLYICTGNYYRSRFAQAVFNHLAESSKLHWQAFSRGLNIDAVTEDGELSVHTLRALQKAGIPEALAGERRVSLSGEDLVRADRILALKRTEHEPMMREQFPDWADRIDYAEVHDLDVYGPDVALPRIEEMVRLQVEALG